MGSPTSDKVPVVILILLISVIMVPVELGFNIGPLFFTWSKLFLIIFAFVMLPKIAALKLQIYDWMFIGHGLWSATAFVVIYGPGAAVERSGTYILEFIVVYLAARVYLTNIGQIQAVIRLLFIMVLVAAIAALPEAVMRVRYIHNFATSITGIRYRFDNEVRMGIMRAASFFEHPILHGIFCSSLFSLVWFTSTVRQRILRVPVIGLGTFLAASSAPLLILMLQIMLLGLERVTRQIKRRVMIITSIAVGAAAFLNIFSGRGVVGFLALVTLNPGTAYTRRSQWEFGIDDVMRHPIFGFDTPTWTRPFWLAGSVDNYWLFMMMRSGIPSVLLLAGSAYFIWSRLARNDTTLPAFRQMRIGWGLMMVALILGGATVAYFGKLQPLFAFYIGLGAALASNPLPDENQPLPDTQTAQDRSPRYSRFAPKPAKTPPPLAAHGARKR